MKTVLITGLRGKTGRQVAQTLLGRKGVVVRGAARNPEGLKVPDISVSRFDWEDRASWPDALSGVHAVYLLRPKTPDPAETIASFLSLAEGVERIVFLSEIEAAHRAESTDERRVEAVIQSAPTGWTILRPNWFMQNFAEPGFYLEALRDAGELKVPTGGQPTSFVDTRDIARVAAAALLEPGHEGRAYTLTGPRALTWAEAASAIGAAAGHDIRYADPPLEDYLAALSSKGTSKATVEYYGRIYGSIREGRTAAVSADVERVTGRSPIDFGRFVEEHKQVWRRAGRT